MGRFIFGLAVVLTAAVVGLGARRTGGLGDEKARSLRHAAAERVGRGLPVN